MDEVSKDTNAHYCKSSPRNIKPASEALPPGTGMPAALWGDVEGFRVERNPSTELPARTQAFDGQRFFTRAARSARLRFAVILLSETYPIATNHLFHRKRSPFPLICPHFFGHFYFSPKGVFLSWMLP